MRPRDRLVGGLARLVQGLLLAALLSCSETPTDPCTSDRDCGPCQTCQDGSCETDPAQLNGWGQCGGAGDAAAGDNVASEAAMPDASTTDRTTADRTTADRTTADRTTADGSTADASVPDSARPDTSLPDTSPFDAARPDVGPLYDPCEELLLSCLDTAPADVLEAPTELSFADAMATAQANQTIQVRGLRLGGGWRVPPYVTLRGCEGATIEGWVGFEGSGGTVEGFEIKGQGMVLADQTGAYVIRRNRVVSGGESFEAAISARSVEPYIYADVTVVIERNSFADRRLGVSLATRYDVGSHAVTATIRDNTFAAVEYPIRVDEIGMVGVIAATIEHNTFHDFVDAISLHGVAGVTPSSGNLFSLGELAVAGDSQFEAHYAFVWQVTEESTLPPFTGGFAVGDPAFADAARGDLRLTSSSAMIDVIPAGAVVPGFDLYGCSRPVDYRGGGARADCGAIEAQPE